MAVSKTAPKRATGVNRTNKATQPAKEVAAQAVPEPLPKVEKQQPEKKISKNPKTDWVIKDRVYHLRGNKNPISATIKGKGIYYFDEAKGYERELKYTSNQRSPFVDEFKGPARLAHISFEDGSLLVPKEKQTLQKLLSLYHPDLNKKYYEHSEEEVATNEVDEIELMLDALNMARDMNLTDAEGIVRVSVGSKAGKMSSEELRRDLLVLAQNDPVLFLELANDPNVQVRNIGIKAVEQGIISLSGDQRTFQWLSTGRKLMTVPFDENPYSALAAWFKTDEGVEVYQTIEKRLK